MTDSNGFSLPEQNITVVGAFNPAILEPAWMLLQLPDLPSPIETLMPAHGGALVHVSADRGFAWSATTQRLQVFGRPALTSQVVRKILDLLPHTPLRALGVNFVYAARIARGHFGPWTVMRDDNDARRVLGGEPGATVISQVVDRSDGVQLNAKITWPGAGADAVLELNYHTEARGADNPARAAELQKHAERVEEFELDAERIKGALIDG